ncbi:MAG TPA: NUDIX domain-containing protein [Vicinamibacterales bacterium]|jgi:colanic acid biosynthesis protein WcaH|nr:NUDIX domain-containing protein [Vicinamibacterales bacterium]
MTPLTEHIDAIEAVLPDTRHGLPEAVLEFVSRLTPLVNVDLLIKDDRGCTLLTWRDDAFFGPGWHVPGSIIRYKERTIDRVHACAREELGADVESEAQPLFILEGINRAQTRGHHVSLLFRCRLRSALDERRRATADPPSAGQWRWHERSPVNLLREQAAYARFIG